jgi:hypothetical protein
MNLTEEQLKELETMAGLFFTVEDIMIALELPLFDEPKFSDIIKYQKTHPAFIAYNRGRLTSETELRQAIKQAAMNGSNPAQNSMMEFYNKSKL